MKRFIKLVRENKSDFIHALERRKSTSVYNKEKHQKVIDCITNDQWSDFKDILLDDIMYRNKQLEGVVLVFTDYDWAIKRMLWDAYNEMTLGE